MGALDKVLLAAEGSSASDEEVHEHLMKECPWYMRVSEERCCTDPDEHCKPAGGTVSLTPRTPEASTVDQPTVPPGGPGLFHVKGMHLPPYIQHLSKHLVARYGKHEAYRVAVGVVEKWAKGVNPGGWKTKSGKGKRTHPDVKAAAVKNIAEWHADEARAHAKSREHVKATVTLSSLITPHKDSEQPFPGQERLALPPVPSAKVTKSMYTAHRVDDSLRHLAHAAERLASAKQGKALRGYHMIHVNNHLSAALDTAHNLVEAVRTNYFPEARELAALNKTMGLAVSVTADAKVATFAHLLQTLLYHEAHAKRHAVLMLDPEPDAVWRFNFDHAARHVKAATEHCFKFAKHIQDNYPDEAKWLTELDKIEDPNDPLTGLEGVRLAAQNMGTATAPGAKPIAPSQKSQYGLYQKPSQTTSPSPPLPPLVALPTPAEVRKLIGQVPECTDGSLSASARKHLEAAATKLSKDDTLGALHVLRSAQSDIYAAHKADLGAAGPDVYTANIFARVPSAAVSSANTSMLASHDRAMVWRSLEQQVAFLVDRIRRRHFHGLYAGSPLARFSGSALDKVLRLGSG